MKTIAAIILSFLLSASYLAEPTYYISNDGNDLNNGLTPSKPWKTIVQFRAGCTYLFKKGDTFYLNIESAPGQPSMTQTTISSYGSGSRPLLTLLKTIKPNKWKQYDNGIFSVNIGDAENYSGFQHRDTNVGYLKVDGVIYGGKKFELGALSKEWDFYSTDSLLYVYAPGQSITSRKIEVSCNVPAIRLCNNMKISDIRISGTGGHGISGNNNVNISIKNVDISEIGGSNLPRFGNGKVRYGNGIEFFNGCKNCEIKNCRISEVYDAAITMQGNLDTINFNHVTISNNVLFNNEQSFETWIRGGGTGFTRCKFINNDCSNAGYGWSHQYRPAQYEGVHLLSYDLDCRSYDLLIEGNKFSKARSGLYFFLDEPNSPKFSSTNNKISLPKGVPIRSIAKFTKGKKLGVEKAKEFVDSTGFEKRSTFKMVKE